MPLESNRPAAAPIGVGDVLRDLLAHPGEMLLRRWNWKAALLSACIRGSLWFVANLSAGLDAAVNALLIEGAFYALIAGFYGALIQAFRRAEPPWQATLTVMGLLPAVNHTIEFALHTIGGTEKVGAGVAASICLSIVSAAFNLFAMRRGALLTGEERRSFLEDLRRLPGIVVEFLLVVPLLLRRRFSDAPRAAAVAEPRALSSEPEGR